MSEPTKTCPKCKEDKPLAAFWRSNTNHDGRYVHCGQCLKTGVSSNVKTRRQQLRQYGMTPEDYDARMAAQGSVCAVCRRPSEKLFVDHDHRTGRVRGLLCLDCNLGVGLFGDSAELMARAIAYLRKHKGG